MKVQYSNVDSKAAPTKVKVPPRFELGSPDSKSRLLTITPWDRDWHTDQVVLAAWDNQVWNRQSTNNTADGLLARAMWVRERRASDWPVVSRPGGATVARLTPDQKVACSNHVRVSVILIN